MGLQTFKQGQNPIYIEVINDELDLILKAWKCKKVTEIKQSLKKSDAMA